MKFVTDVDSGEVFPVEEFNENEIDLPAYVKDDFPEIKVNYSGENGSNDIILDLSHQLKDEKLSKTVYHKFPIIKILFAVIITSFVVVGAVIGVRFATSLNFEPITIEYSDNSTTATDVYVTASEEHSEETQIQNDNSNDDFSIFGLNLPLFSKISQLLPVLISTILIVLALRFAINLLMKGIF